MPPWGNKSGCAPTSGTSTWCQKLGDRNLGPGVRCSDYDKRVTDGTSTKMVILGCSTCPPACSLASQGNLYGLWVWLPTCSRPAWADCALQEVPSGPLQLPVESRLFSHNHPLTACEMQPSLMTLSLPFHSFLHCCLLSSTVPHVMSCGFPCPA